MLEKEKFVSTILGRRRYLRDIESDNSRIRDFALRQAVNAPIQGSCADIIKRAMIQIHNEFRKAKFRAKLILQIHDELVFDLPKSELKKIIPIVRQNMEEAVSLNVPIKVNLKCGPNWSEMSPVT